MQNFIDLLNDVVTNGVDKDDRTGVGSRSVFGRMLRWDLAQGFPIITTRKVALRIAFEETMFFLRGETNTKLLEEKKINIWKGNTSREFLDNRGLQHLPEGSIGTGYSHNWRNFGGTLGENDGVDQIKELLVGIKNDPLSRRHIVTGWNPLQMSGTPLPPCHIMNMYSVENGKLNSSFVMRSNDVPFGLPYNIMSYALLNHMFAKHLNLESGDLVYMGWDVHIYQNQMKMVNEQLTRTPLALPKLNIKKDLPTLSDILSLQWEDIELIGHNSHPDIKDKPEMAK
jgi:thymidylate synthase